MQEPIEMTLNETKRWLALYNKVARPGLEHWLFTHVISNIPAGSPCTVNYFYRVFYINVRVMVMMRKVMMIVMKVIAF